MQDLRGMLGSVVPCSGLSCERYSEALRWGRGWGKMGALNVLWLFSKGLTPPRDGAGPLSFDFGFQNTC